MRWHLIITCKIQFNFFTEKSINWNISYRNNPVSPINQLLTTLRWYASNSHQISVGDFMGFNQSTVSRIVSKVTNAIAGLRPLYISMPTNNEILHTQEKFYRIARFPRVVGCIDGTHIKIQSPGKTLIFEYGKKYINFF